MNVPRISGSAFRKSNGKWTFFLLVGELGVEECDRYDFDLDFKTKKLAIAELKQAARIAAEAFEQALTGKVSGNYIDMKTNSTRKWDESDQH